MLEIRTTVRDKYEAKLIAEILVKEKKAASVRMKKVHSIYRWKKMVHYNKEVELSILTADDKTEDVTEIIKALSSYELPEILIYNLATTKEFNNWCKESCE